MGLQIELENVGRRFNREWVFKGMDYRFEQGMSYAVLGSNGSGKSTLLQVLLSSLSPSSGQIKYSLNGSLLDVGAFYAHVGFASPYLELIEEFTLKELLDFHFKFKKPIAGMGTGDIVDLLGFSSSLDKEIRYFSSGMKQRTKLALACCSQTEALFLDEPTSNLDRMGFDWYLRLIRQFRKDRLLVICSNQPHEYDFCDERIAIADYK